MVANVETGISIAVGYLSIVAFVISVFKNKKTKTLAEIIAKIPSYISEAETIFGGGTGAAKLSYVINKVSIDCVKSNVKMSEEEIKNKVESILKTPQSNSTRNDIVS